MSLCGRLAREEGLDVIIVFDGAPVSVVRPKGVLLFGETGRSADDLIVEITGTLGPGTSVATSDRGLRARLGEPGVSVVGGGTFARDLIRHRGT